MRTFLGLVALWDITLWKVAMGHYMQLKWHQNVDLSLKQNLPIVLGYIVW